MKFDKVLQSFDDGTELTVGDFVGSCIIGAIAAAAFCVAIEGYHQMKDRRYNKMYEKKYQYYSTK